MNGPVLVTGITGFVGTALARRLVEEGLAVRGLVRPTASAATTRWLAGLGVDLRAGDVTDPRAVAAATAGARTVVHSAAVIAYRRRRYGVMQRTNVVGTRHVVGAAAREGVERLVHVSSIAAVGVSREPRLLDEDAPFNAGPLRAPYFDTKRAAEEVVMAAAAAGLPATVVNPGAIYGASALPSNSSQVLARIAAGSVRRVPRGGINVVPLETVVDGILAAARRGRPGRRYILGGENLSYADLVTRGAAAAGRTLAPATVPDALGAVARVAMDAVEPLVPDRVWFTPDMAALFGRWMWFDTGRAERELLVPPGDVDRCLAETVEQLRRDGRLAAS